MNGNNDDMLEFDGRLLHETELAWLFWVEDTEEEVWFPKSKCTLSGDLSSLGCPRWLARQKDLL